MKTTINVNLLGLNQDMVHYARKVIDLPFVIPKGTMIEDSAWKDERRIAGTTFSIQDNSLFVSLESVPLEVGDETVEERKERYEFFGWTVRP